MTAQVDEELYCFVGDAAGDGVVVLRGGVWSTGPVVAGEEGVVTAGDVVVSGGGGVDGSEGLSRGFGRCKNIVMGN